MPYARSIVALRCQRSLKSSGTSSEEARYYVSSIPAGELSPQKWDELIRGHWAGSEIRNHWRRDAIMGEDRSRTRNPVQLANLALLRNAVIAILATRYPEENYVQIVERLQENPKTCFELATKPF